MELNRPHYKLNMSDIFKPLTIGRQRHKLRDRDKPTRRRRPSRKTTPEPDKDANANASVNEDDHNKITTTQSVKPVVSAVTSSEPSVDEGERGELAGDSDHDGDDDHDHNTDHDDFTCQPATSQHSAYIRDNLELLQKKCKEFHACTQELYRAENFHRILSGDNIQLSNMCGLMYANGGGRYTTLHEQCAAPERNAIRQDIGSSLSDSLASLPKGEDKPAWKRLKRCLEHNTKDNEEHIDTACRLKENSEFLCEDFDVDQVTEEFFNQELEHLHCSCKAITAEAANANAGSRVPLPVRIGIVGGVLGLLIILIVVVIVLCYRHRKVKQELEKHRMQYLPSPHGEPSAIYQEIGNSQPMDALRRAKDQGKLPMDYNFLDQAPALPERYVKDLSGSRPNLVAAAEGDSEYLEPIPDPRGRQLEAHANDAYNASQGSQQSGNSVYQLAKQPGPSPPMERATQPENPTYFDRLQFNRAENVDGGYSSLGRKYAAAREKGAVEDASAEETEPLNKKGEAEGGSETRPEESKYFVLEPQKEASEREALTAAGSTEPV